METSLLTGFAQIFSCCPKNLSCPKFGGAAAPLALPARMPLVLLPGQKMKYVHLNDRLCVLNCFIELNYDKY